MDDLTEASNHIHTLRAQIAATETQLGTLKLQLQQAEHPSLPPTTEPLSPPQTGIPAEWTNATLPALQENVQRDIAQRLRQERGLEDAPTIQAASQRRRWPLATHEYSRYGRQLIMPEIGLRGQLHLKNARVLIVGLGGLGCPAAAYLAGAGVGTLGLVDGDTVEESNLHRQLAHATARVGWNKAESAKAYLSSLNGNVRYDVYKCHLRPESAVEYFGDYDVVLDCTDHPTSRYLISDACVLAGKPLVSASALKTEGQLIVLNNPPAPPGDATGGPCYRCIFPKPPPAASVLSCGEGGILGPVVGVMGVLQALEAIKIITAAKPMATDDPVKPTMLMFSAYSNPQFRSVRMRARRAGCAICSSEATLTAQSLTSGSLDYVAFCGAQASVDIVAPEQRVSATTFSRLPMGDNGVLIDVRDETQFGICALRESVNVPWTGSAERWVQSARDVGVDFEDGRQMFTVCRFGNDSQLAARAITETLPSTINGASAKNVRVKHIEGGFEAWRKEVDPTWPDY